MKFIFSLSSFVIFAINALIGFFLLKRPASAIEIQKKFYEKINWRIEPIFMEKEIRNTKIMGFFLIILAIAASTYTLIITGAM